MMSNDRRHPRLILAMALLLAAWAVPTGAQDKDLEATVTGFTGLVRVRTAGDQPWKKPEVGMKLGPGAEFQTGPRSAVRFTIPPNQTITLDRLGVMTVLTAVQSAQGKVTTDLGLKYGRTRYDIEEAGVEHASTIRTPSAQLAVRGTGVGFQEDFQGFAWCNEHVAYFTGHQQQEIEFGEPSEVTTDIPDPGRKQMADGTVDPADPNARQDNERELIIERPDGNFDLRNNGIQDLQQLLPSTDEYHSTQGSGDLQFQLGWNNTESSATNSGSAYYDLDLFLVAPDSSSMVLHTPNADHISSGIAIQQYAQQHIDANAQLVNELNNGAMMTLTDNGDLGSASPVGSGDGLRLEEAMILRKYPLGQYLVGVHMAASQVNNDPTPNDVTYQIKVSRFVQDVGDVQMTASIVDFLTASQPTAVHTFNVGANGVPTAVDHVDVDRSPPQGDTVIGG